MAVLSSPDSASDGYSPRSSPTRVKNANVPSQLPSQAALTTPARNADSDSNASSTPDKHSQRRAMPFASNSAINGFSGSGSQKPQSTFASQASTLATQDNRDEMIRDVAQPDEGPGTSTERSLTVRDNQHEGYANPIEDLPLKDWKELEARYERDMEAAIQNEQTIMAEIEWVMKMMKESTIASSRTASERATKRLRTRIAYVQQSEEALAEKRTQYKGVVDAFQNAMALLGGI